MLSIFTFSTLFIVYDETGTLSLYNKRIYNDFKCSQSKNLKFRLFRIVIMFRTLEFITITIYQNWFEFVKVYINICTSNWTMIT